MKHDHFIRESLNQNLSGLHVSRQQQMNMIEEIIGGTKMKRKTHVTIALVAVLILTSVTALAVGTNLFGYFAGRDARYGRIAEQAANVTAEPVKLDSAELGPVNARIDSAYYDGQTLSVGLLIENSTRIEAYTPSTEELTNARRVLDPVRPMGNTEQERQILAAFDAAVESGTPYGYVLYRVYPSDHTYANEVDLPPYTGVEDYDVGGTYRTIRDYGAPLPGELQDLDALSLRIRLYETAGVHYFDGTTIYHYELAIREAGAVTAMVPRTDAELHSYAGSAEIGGVGFSAEAEFTAMQGRITLTADQDVLRPVTYAYEGEVWQAPAWQLVVMDESGREYRSMDSDGESLLQFNPMVFSVEGSGEFPEELHIYLLHAGEEPDTYDFWPEAGAKLKNVHLCLTRMN